MIETPTNHQTIARSRVVTQYLDSAKFLAVINALMAWANETEQTLQDVALQSSIDLAEGVNLDVIGDIIGFSRVVDNALPLPFFGFFGQPGVLTFGEETDPSIGARFREELEPATGSTTLTDAEYRPLIRAKILKNVSTATVESLIANAKSLLGVATTIYVYDAGTMEIGIGIGKLLTTVEQALLRNLDMLVRPAGVSVTLWSMWSGDAFGFDDTIGAQNWGGDGDPVGAPFAQEF